MLEMFTLQSERLVSCVLLVGAGAVSLSSNVQSRVVRSTAGADFIAGESCTRDMTFFLYIWRAWATIVIPQALGMDNQSAIHTAKPKESGTHETPSTISNGLEQVDAGETSPHFILTQDMPADMLTKSLP